ncbi:hypothetical protein [Streptomyces sp. SA15]|uniref:hypothetical protein n=1 Tax=Streptomyces sp. SA15 TaxID=934019 RepID=UPI0015C8EEFC|nr:hypothetical protein [Streptomyces sp. SA15]
MSRLKGDVPALGVSRAGASLRAVGMTDGESAAPHRNGMATDPGAGPWGLL